MTHITERTGSPQTLVCTKTRQSYEKCCYQYQLDVKAMKALVPLFPEADEMMKELREKLITAVGVGMN